MAEEEARKISDRTKKALAAAKVRGVKLGEHGKLLSRREKTKADAFASELQDVLRKLLKCDGLSFRDAATQLNNMGIATARGGSWHSTSVHRTWSRLGA
jgi:DNA invertase Pin-like site-specific DNA recombinase